MQTEVVEPFRNGLTMVALFTMVLVVALELGVDGGQLTRAVSAFMGGLGLTLGPYVVRMQRPVRNDESAEVVAITVFGFVFLLAGNLLFPWILDDRVVGLDVAYFGAYSFMVGGCVGVLLLTLVRGTTRELLIDVGIIDPELWPAPEAEEPDGRNRRAWPRSVDGSMIRSVLLLLAGLDSTEQPDEHEAPASRGDGHPGGGRRHLRALREERKRSPNTGQAGCARGLSPVANRQSGRSGGWRHD